MSKVLVGMSGGVDSLVAAIILKNQGHSVTGGTLPICGGLSNNIAEKLCEMIGIPFARIDTGNLFKTKVIDYFKDSLGINETPNPCIICNQHVKLFGLHKYAADNGFDYISTGHYAKISEFCGRTTVERGIDPHKDQSYMLCRVPEDILKMTILPIGDITRFDAEIIAKDYPTSEPSQDACFVKGGMTEWISREVGLGESGPILDQNCNTLGNHIGLRAYTIGQREGLRLSGGPWFVVGKDTQKNALVVAHREDAMVSEFMVRDVDLCHNKDISVMVRYRAEPVRCDLESICDEITKVTTQIKVFAPTPGQFAVFYCGDFVVGSAIIS